MCCSASFLGLNVSLFEKGLRHIIAVDVFGELRLNVSLFEKGLRH